MGKASQFLAKMKFVENLDTEGEFDKTNSRQMEAEAPVAPNIDTDDEQILAVMNGYFKHINKMDDAAKVDQLQDLAHRLANVMLGMPGGEKELRKALKGAIAGFSPKQPETPMAPKMGEARKRKLREQLQENPEAAQRLQKLMDKFSDWLTSMQGTGIALRNEVKKSLGAEMASAFDDDLNSVSVLNIIQNKQDAEQDLLSNLEMSMDESAESDQLQSQIDGLKKQKDDLKVQMDQAGKDNAGKADLKDKMAGIDKQIADLQDRKSRMSTKAENLKKATKQLREDLNPRLVSSCERAYQALESELKYVMEYLDSAKPEQAGDDDELKACIQEAKDLMNEVQSLKWLRG